MPTQNGVILTFINGDIRLVHFNTLAGQVPVKAGNFLSRGEWERLAQYRGGGMGYIHTLNIESIVGKSFTLIVGHTFTFIHVIDNVNFLKSVALRTLNYES